MSYFLKLDSGLSEEYKEALTGLTEALTPSRTDLASLVGFVSQPVEQLKAWDTHLEQGYTAWDEVAVMMKDPSVMESLGQCASLDQLMEVSVEHGLYYLFKYLYVAKKTPLKLALYNKHFPTGALYSNRPDLNESEARTNGVHEKVNVQQIGRTSRISKLFEAHRVGLRANSRYSTSRSGAAWTYKF